MNTKSGVKTKSGMKTKSDLEKYQVLFFLAAAPVLCNKRWKAVDS